jgi:hypothetical protein
MSFLGHSRFRRFQRHLFPLGNSGIPQPWIHSRIRRKIFDSRSSDEVLVGYISLLSPR